MEMSEFDGKNNGTMTVWNHLLFHSVIDYPNTDDPENPSDMVHESLDIDLKSVKLHYRFCFFNNIHSAINFKRCLHKVSKTIVPLASTFSTDMKLKTAS